MDSHLAAAYREDRLQRLVAPLQYLATLALAEFPDWKAIALTGAAAAAAGDRAGVRDSCGNCHAAYRAQYRAAMRTRPVIAANPGRRP